MDKTVLPVKGTQDLIPDKGIKIPHAGTWHK